MAGGFAPRAKASRASVSVRVPIKTWQRPSCTKTHPTTCCTWMTCSLWEGVTGYRPLTILSTTLCDMQKRSTTLSSAWPLLLVRLYIFRPRHAFLPHFPLTVCSIRHDSLNDGAWSCVQSLHCLPTIAAHLKRSSCLGWCARNMFQSTDKLSEYFSRGQYMLLQRAWRPAFAGKCRDLYSGVGQADCDRLNSGIHLLPLVQSIHGQSMAYGKSAVQFP